MPALLSAKQWIGNAVNIPLEIVKEMVVEQQARTIMDEEQWRRRRSTTESGAPLNLLDGNFWDSHGGRVFKTSEADETLPREEKRSHRE